MSSKDTIKISSSKKIVGNTILSSLSELSLVFTSIFYILAARFLGDLKFGIFNTALGYVGIFSPFIVLGFTYSITKVIVKQRSKVGIFVSNALFVQFIVALFIFIICFGITFAIDYPSNVKYLIIIVFIAELLRCFGLTIRAACKAMGKFHFDTIAVNTERIFLLIFGLLFLILGYGLFTLALILLISRFISFVLFGFFIYKIDSKVVNWPNLNVCKWLLKKSWIYIIQSVFWRIYNYIDVVMISIMRSFSEVGWYSAGRRIIEGLWIIPNIITEAIYPELSARHLVSHEMVVKLFERSFKYTLSIAVIVSIGTVMLAKVVIGLIYGPEFKNTVIVLMLLGSAVVPSYLCYLFGNTLIAINLQKKGVYISAGRSVFNIFANLVLIPFYGYVGATIATVATDYFTIIGHMIILKKAGVIKRSQIKFIVKPFIAVVFIIPFYLLTSFLNVYLQFVMIVVLYVILIVVLKIFDQEEIRIFKRYISNKLLFFKKHP